MTLKKRMKLNATNGSRFFDEKKKVWQYQQEFNGVKLNCLKRDVMKDIKARYPNAR